MICKSKAVLIYKIPTTNLRNSSNNVKIDLHFYIPRVTWIFNTMYCWYRERNLNKYQLYDEQNQLQLYKTIDFLVFLSIYQSIQRHYKTIRSKIRVCFLVRNKRREINLKRNKNPVRNENPTKSPKFPPILLMNDDKLINFDVADTLMEVVE